MIEQSLLASRVLNVEAKGPNRVLVTVEPFERGFGHTLGTALRRTLLSSLPGCAVVEAHIEGVLHEYTTVEGVQEDVLDILLNLKGIGFVLHGRDEVELTLVKTSVGPVRAGDIKLPHDVSIVNPEYIIAHLTKDREFKMTLKVARGRGSQEAFSWLREGQGTDIGSLYLNADFNPVRRVHYTVERARVGQHTDLDKLVIDLETNGSIDPAAALDQAASILQEQLAIFRTLHQTEQPIALPDTSQEPIDPILLRSIETLKLTQRATNCLNSKCIYYIGDLVKTNEKELCDIHNFGTTSLEQVKIALQGIGLALGTSLPHWPPPSLSYPDIEKLDSFDDKE